MELATSWRLYNSSRKKIADDYNQILNFPNCIGSINGKYILMQGLKSSSSSHFNYKGTHNSHYRNILVSIKEAGRSSDGATFANNHLRDCIWRKTLNLTKS